MLALSISFSEADIFACTAEQVVPALKAWDGVMDPSFALLTIDEVQRMRLISNWLVGWSIAKSGSSLMQTSCFSTASKRRAEVYLGLAMRNIYKKSLKAVLMSFTGASQNTKFVCPDLRDGYLSGISKALLLTSK